MWNKLIQRISDSRSDIRLCIFIISQIFILTESTCASIVVGTLALLSVVLCICHIHSIKQQHAAKCNCSLILKQGIYSIFFCIVMLLIWYLSARLNS